MGMQENLTIFLGLLMIYLQQMMETNLKIIAMKSTHSKLILTKGNTSHTETTFLDLHLCINEGQIQTSLYHNVCKYVCV